MLTRRGLVAGSAAGLLSATLDATAQDRAAPVRFVGLAMLPMQDPGLALQELDRVGTLPGLRGIYMGTHINGRNLDAKEYWPIYARCEQRGLPIFLHPVDPVGADRMRSYHLRNFIGNPAD